MCGGSKAIGDVLSGGATAVLDKTHNSNLPGGATTDQVRKSFYDPLGLFGGGGDQLWSRLGLTGKGKTPDVVTSDPKGDAAKAAAAAQGAANATTAENKRKRANSSLLATGGRGVLGEANTSSVLAYGKPTLGS